MNTFISAAAFVMALRVGLDLNAAETNRGRRDHTISHFQDYKAVGFDHVRIRVREDVNEMALDSSGETKGQVLLNDIRTVVDDAREVGLIPIIAYHGGPVEEDVNETNEAIFVNWWKTVSAEFSSYPNELAFDLIIEVTDDLKSSENQVVLNRIYSDVISFVRITQPNRILIAPPSKLSEPRELYALTLPSPANDAYIAAEWHDYAAGPQLFTGYDEDASDEQKVLNDVSTLPFAVDKPKYWNELETTLVRSQNRQRIRETIAVAKRWNRITGIPLWIGAWMYTNFNKGAQPNGDYSKQEQIVFANFCAHEFEKGGIPHAWNADKKFHELLPASEGGGTWFPEQLEVLQSVFQPAAPGSFIEHVETTATAETDGYHRVTWVDTGNSLRYSPSRENKFGRTIADIVVTSGAVDPIVQFWYTTYTAQGAEVKKPKVVNPNGDGAFSKTKIVVEGALYFRFVAFGTSGDTYVFELEFPEVA